MSYFTHRVAVNAYLLYKNRFLLLRRLNEPQIWGPPGGRLRKNENPVEGLVREIFEETGLHAHVKLPVTTWFGEFNGQQLFSVDYLCTCDSDKVILSLEHDAWRWLALEELRENKENYFATGKGFQLKDFELALSLEQAIENQKIRL